MFSIEYSNGTLNIDPDTIDWADINYTPTGSGITVKPKNENTTQTKREAILTVTVTPENSNYEALSVEISLSQGINSGSSGDPTEETIDSGTFTGDSNAIEMTTDSGITITQLKNGSTNVNLNYNTVSTLRVYRANQISFTGKTFTKLEMYYTGTYSGADWSVAAGTGSVSIDTDNKKVV